MKKFLSEMAAEQFNEFFSVGAKFFYYSIKSSDSPVLVTTQSMAWELGRGDTVVSVSGVSGGVAITHLSSVLTKNQMTALASIAGGADVYTLRPAAIYREIEKNAQELITICAPQAYNGDGVDEVPYFGVITTKAGIKYLAAFGVGAAAQLKAGGAE